MQIQIQIKNAPVKPVRSFLLNLKDISDANHGRITLKHPLTKENFRVRMLRISAKESLFLYETAEKNFSKALRFAICLSNKMKFARIYFTLISKEADASYVLSEGKVLPLSYYEKESCDTQDSFSV